MSVAPLDWWRVGKAGVIGAALGAAFVVGLSGVEWLQPKTKHELSSDEYSSYTLALVVWAGAFVLVPFAGFGGLVAGVVARSVTAFASALAANMGYWLVLYAGLFAARS